VSALEWAARTTLYRPYVAKRRATCSNRGAALQCEGGRGLGVTDWPVRGRGRGQGEMEDFHWPMRPFRGFSTTEMTACCSPVTPLAVE